jgi:hypothetical protein
LSLPSVYIIWIVYWPNVNVLWILIGDIPCIALYRLRRLEFCDTGDVCVHWTYGLYLDEWRDRWKSILNARASFVSWALACTKLHTCTEHGLRKFYDTVSERLRRWTRNPLGSARRGSNPLGVVSFAKKKSAGVHF